MGSCTLRTVKPEEDIPSYARHIMVELISNVSPCVARRTLIARRLHDRTSVISPLQVCEAMFDVFRFCSDFSSGEAISEKDHRGVGYVVDRFVNDVNHSSSSALCSIATTKLLFNF